MGDGPLHEHALRQHVFPLFSRTLGAQQSRGEIYLANHSLGRPLDQTEDDVLEGLRLWYERLDGAWEDDGWPREQSRFRAAVAHLLGITDPRLVVPKTSAGQGLRAVLNALPVDGSLRPLRVVATRGEFDSIDFILKTYQSKGRAEISWVEPEFGGAVNRVDEERICQAIGPGTDLVVVSHVLFATGQVLQDVPSIAARAREAGALLLVDAYHSAGVLPFTMESLQADFLIGGSYKYTRGGPGACWLALAPSIVGRELRTLDTGWFAKLDPFSYERPEAPLASASGDAWLESTPPVLTYYQARAGLELTLALGVERLRAYSFERQSQLRDAFRFEGVELFEPDEPARFGAFSLLPHPHASTLVGRLKEDGVNADARSGFVRFGPDILNTDDDFREAARRAAKALSEAPQ